MGERSQHSSYQNSGPISPSKVEIHFIFDDWGITLSTGLGIVPRTNRFSDLARWSAVISSVQLDSSRLARWSKAISQPGEIRHGAQSKEARDRRGASSLQPEGRKNCHTAIL
jgi:hypothetical protein